MKRYGNLYDAIISIDNLKLADEKARKGKLRTYGVRHHDKTREANIMQLHETLKNCDYHTSRYDTFTIFEPKERHICRLPYFPDRIVHHAIMNVLEPIWVSLFINTTYSCIKKRGIHKCALDVRRALDEDCAGTKYCLKIDIRKFYESIDHDIMKQIVRRKIKDVRLLKLIDEIIDSHNSIPGAKKGKGLPIGNYMSQYLANLYLTYFDHYVKETLKVKHYFRYADDIVVLAATKAELHDILYKMRGYLSGLKLCVKANYQIFPVDSRGIDFVGYVFRHTHTLMRKKVKKALCKRVAKLHHRATLPSERYYKQQIASWWGWCKYCDSVNLFNTLKFKIPYELHFSKRRSRSSLRQRTRPSCHAGA